MNEWWTGIAELLLWPNEPHCQTSFKKTEIIKVNTKINEVHESVLYLVHAVLISLVKKQKQPHCGRSHP